MVRARRTHLICGRVPSARSCGHRWPRLDGGWWSLYEGSCRGKEILASRSPRAAHHAAPGHAPADSDRVVWQVCGSISGPTDRPANRAFAMARKALFQSATIIDPQARQVWLWICTCCQRWLGPAGLVICAESWKTSAPVRESGVYVVTHPRPRPTRTLPPASTTAQRGSWPRYRTHSSRSRPSRSSIPARQHTRSA